jgi:hypothetical protein
MLTTRILVIDGLVADAKVRPKSRKLNRDVIIRDLVWFEREVRLPERGRCEDRIHDAPKPLPPTNPAQPRRPR